MMFELLLKVMERTCEIPTLNAPSPVANLFCSAILHSKFPSILRIGAHTCNHTVPYGRALLGRRYPRHFVPGYDHALPLGRNKFRAEVLIKLALMGFSDQNGPPARRSEPDWR
jgi:hypothetical protein